MVFIFIDDMCVVLVVNFKVNVCFEIDLLVKEIVCVVIIVVLV